MPRDNDLQAEIDAMSSLPLPRRGGQSQYIGMQGLQAMQGMQVQSQQSQEYYGHVSRSQQQELWESSLNRSRTSPHDNSMPAPRGETSSDRN